MTKVVKEFLLDNATGEVSFEYDDNSTSKYNLSNAVTATQSAQGVEFDEPTTAAIIAIAGDAGSSSTVQIVDGYPVEVTGTTEVLVSAVPCDVIWIAHNGVTGTITVRDAGVTGTGITAVKTIDMAATPTLQPGSLRTQFGVTATLTAGKATFWVRPL